MKFISIRFTLILSSILSVSSHGFSQHNPILENFSVREVSGDVFLSWTIVSGNTCNGIRIYRSVDGVQFSEIGDIAGVCGSTSSPTPYDFLDSNPTKNSLNYYRLELGSNGSSEILVLEVIDIQNGGYKIRPNPVSTSAKIYFDNDNNVLHFLSLYNLNGQFIASLKSEDDYFDFDASQFMPGLYFFHIFNENLVDKAKGNILVQY